MTAPFTTPDEDPLENQRRIDAVCDQYEAAFRSGHPVAIEFLLRTHAALPQTDLLRELIALEVDLRRKSGFAPSREEYLQRFPDSGGILRMIPPQLFTGTTEEDIHEFTVGVVSGSDSGKAPEQQRGAETARHEGRRQSASFPQIPGFTILSQIGQGGMGVVYRATQEDLKRSVAIKVLKLDGRMDRRQILRFQNEAQAAAHLQHTNIVPVFHTGHINGLHYYVMQLIDGRDLADHIQEAKERLNNRRANASNPTPVMTADSTVVMPGRGAVRSHQETAGSGSQSWPSPEFLDSLEHARSTATGRHLFKDTVRIGIQAAEALHHAHLHGVVHRDIKPSNLMLGDDGRVWVTDFGLAQVQGAAALTMTGEVLGTYRYMSPEQPLANHVLLDQRTDIYSLGVTLYELLTLKKAFDGANSKEILRQVCFEDPVAPRRLNPAISEDLETIVLKCMSKRPEERYQTALELAEDLRRFMDDEPILARRPSLWQRCRRWSVRHPATAAALAVSFVLLSASSAIAASVLYRQARNESQLRQRAEIALADAEAGRLTALSMASRDTNPTLATLLAIEAANKKTDEAAASVALVEALRSNHELRSWNPRGRNVLETGMALHPDGKRVVTTVARGLVHSGDFPAVESDVMSGKVLRPYGTTGVVTSAAWSPDGNFLLTTTIRQTTPSQELDSLPVEVTLWDSNNRRAVVTVTESGVHSVTGAEFSTDSRRLVVPSKNGTLRIFSLPDGTELGPVTDPGSTLKSLSFSAEGGRLACLLTDGRLRIWDFLMRAWTAEIAVSAQILKDNTGRCVFVNPTTILVAGSGGSRIFSTETQQDLTSGNLPFSDFAVSKSGTSLVLFGAGNQAVVYDAASMQPSCRIEEDLLLDFAILSEDGRHVALVTHNQTVRVYRIPDGRLLATLPMGTLAVTSAAFSGSENLVTLTSQGQLGLWSLKSGRERHTITPNFTMPENLNSPWTISNDSAWVAFTENQRGHTDVFDFTGQKVGAAFPGVAPGTTPDIHGLAVVDSGKIQIRSEAGGGVLQTLNLPEFIASDAWLVPTSKEVLFKSNQGASYLWNSSINALRKLSEPGAVVTDQAVHSVSGTIAIAQDNGAVLVRKTGTQTSQQLQHPARVSAIAFSNSGQLLATADADGQVRIWNLDDLKVLQSVILEETSAEVRQLLFSADEKHIFCRGGAHNLMSLFCWSTETETLQKTAAPIRASGFDLTETPGELVIATDNGLRLWNHETGIESVLSGAPAMKVVSAGGYAFTLEPQNPADPTFSNAMLARYLLTEPANPERQLLDGVALFLTIDRENQRILAGTYAYQATAVSLADNQKLSSTVKHSQPVLLQQFRGATRSLVTASSDGTIAVWDLETNTSRALNLRLPPISDADMDHAGEQMALAHTDGTVQILNLETEQLQTLPQENAADVQQVRMAPNGQHFVTIHRDRRSQLWRLTAEQGATRLSDLLTNTDVICWSVDGQQLLMCDNAATNQQRVEVLRPVTSDRVPIDSNGEIHDARFRSDGQQVLLTEIGQGHRLYSTTTGSLQAEIPHGEKAVFGPTPDQLWLLSREAIVLWDLQRGDAIQQIPHRNIPVEIINAMIFSWTDWQPESPDGKWVLCPGSTLEKWPGNLLEFARQTVPRPLSPQERRMHRLESIPVAR